VQASAAGPASPNVEGEGAATTRTTLRLPDHLKAQVEVAAARDGVSVNTWLVRGGARGRGRHTGWVR
jgi:hypothetical protein